MRSADSSPDPAAVLTEAFRELQAEAKPVLLTRDQLLAAEALRLLMRLDGELREARAQWNQDWFRRVMRIRPKAVARLKRRWAKVNPVPAIRLGNLTRRYHANLAGYLYAPIKP